MDFGGRCADFTYGSNAMMDPLDPQGAFRFAVLQGRFWGEVEGIPKRKSEPEESRCFRLPVPS